MEKTMVECTSITLIGVYVYFMNEYFRNNPNTSPLTLFTSCLIFGVIGFIGRRLEDKYNTIPIFPLGVLCGVLLICIIHWSK